MASAKPSWVLGVNHGWHDGAAALLRDGELQVLVETDRITRVKHGYKQPPQAAMRVCLDEAGITLDDVEVVAVGWDEAVSRNPSNGPYEYDSFVAELLPEGAFPRQRPPRVQCESHHLAHAACAFYTSGFERAAVLVIDGRGDDESTSLGVAGPDGIEWIHEWPIGDSLGNYYGYAADWAGFGYWGAGKLMGLAAYGAPFGDLFVGATEDGYRFVDPVDPALDVTQQERTHRALLDAYFRRIYPFAPGDSGDVMAHARFAATIQAGLERAVAGLVALVVERTGLHDVVLAGGIGLNCTGNGGLARGELVRELFVPPVTADTGVSLGAALLADRRLHPERGIPGRLPHAFWGVATTSDAIDAALADAGLVGRRLPDDDLLPWLADRIADGKVVGWFQGRAEIGQRALGHRSLLADPRDRSRLVQVNQVKGREAWRPLAPSVLEEHAHEFFDEPIPSLADFMLAALPVRPDAWARVPATVHVDGSARPQIVRRATNPRYWALIEAFRARTGVPVVMNTSFNLAGEPIVHTAADAVSSFVRSDIDILVLEDTVVEKGS